MLYDRRAVNEATGIQTRSLFPYVVCGSSLHVEWLPWGEAVPAGSSPSSPPPAFSHSFFFPSSPCCPCRYYSLTVCHTACAASGRSGKRMGETAHTHTHTKESKRKEESLLRVVSILMRYRHDIRPWPVIFKPNMTRLYLYKLTWGFFFFLVFFPPSFCCLVDTNITVALQNMWHISKQGCRS